MKRIEVQEILKGKVIAMFSLHIMYNYIKMYFNFNL